MRETWLRPNRRGMLFACVPEALAAGFGTWVFISTGSLRQWRWYGLATVVLSFAAVAILLAHLFRPRIAYCGGQVLFYLRSGWPIAPIAVPVDVVEAFFLGQGPAHLPGVRKQPETVNLVARLSQRRTEWARQDVKPALGNWCDGYITIRGTWCEPLGTELVRRLNRRLKEAKKVIEDSGKS